MRVFLVGADGFVGRHFLAAAPPAWEVGALVQGPKADAIVRSLGAQPLDGTIDDQRSLISALQKWSPDVSIFLSPLDSRTGRIVVESLEAVEVPRTIFTCAASDISAPSSGWATELRAAEAAIEGSQLGYAILRPTVIYGAPGDRNLEYLLSKLITWPLIPAPNRGRTLMQPVNVYDFAEALIAAAVDPNLRGQAIAIAGPTPLSFAEIVIQAGEALNRPSRVLPVPKTVLRTVVAAYEKLARDPSLTAGRVERLTRNEVVDIGPAQKLLDFTPRSFAEGIAVEAEAVLATVA